MKLARLQVFISGLPLVVRRLESQETRRRSVVQLSLPTQVFSVDDALLATHARFIREGMPLNIP